ncbi:MAG: hypothetical protein ACLTBV_25335 [Enterocloster bolteae]
MSSDDKTATQLTTMDYEELTFEKRVREQKERLGERLEFVVRPYDTRGSKDLGRNHRGCQNSR